MKDLKPQSVIIKENLDTEVIIKDLETHTILITDDIKTHTK